jgi:hypothetical protein
MAFADATYQGLPYLQNWTNAGMITLSDDWSGVPGVIGYRGDDLTVLTGTDPQTLVADAGAPGLVVDVNANQTNPNTFTTGGVAEFDVIADRAVALQGSGTADAPAIVIHLNTTGYMSITVAYDLRDIDGSADNAVQQVALQYRVGGGTGDYTNLPLGYVADASTGPSLATLVTPVSVVLPVAADNQAMVQIRIMTTNAGGSDEWIAIDDINVTGTPIPVAVESREWSSIKSDYR